jgi:MoaA/NifB/PqqE/SkfB family radical SAM enzyme
MVERLKAPITVQLELTKNCNYLCGHCYNFWRYQETGERNFKEPNSLKNIEF